MYKMMEAIDEPSSKAARFSNAGANRRNAPMQATNTRSETTTLR
jgi:hypothetical protein